MDHFSTTANASPSSKPSNNNGKEKKKKGCKRNNTSGVKLSTDPQSVAARERRHRISDRFKILQSLVPGGTKMDTVSMLDEAINYVKFLKTQILLHQTLMNFSDDDLSINNVPSSLNPPQQPLCFDTNFVPEVQLPTSQFLPDSYFQCQEEMCFDSFFNKK